MYQSATPRLSHTAYQNALPLKGTTFTLSTLILSFALFVQLKTISSRSDEETAWKVEPTVNVVNRSRCDTGSA